MKASDRYRRKAVQLCQKANVHSDFELRVEYESLAFAYMCLAEQTERDALEWDGMDACLEDADQPAAPAH